MYDKHSDLSLFHWRWICASRIFLWLHVVFVADIRPPMTLPDTMQGII